MNTEMIELMRKILLDAADQLTKVLEEKDEDWWYDVWLPFCDSVMSAQTTPPEGLPGIMCAAAYEDYESYPELEGVLSYRKAPPQWNHFPQAFLHTMLCQVYMTINT